MQGDAPHRPLAIVVDDDADFARLLARRLESVMTVEVMDTAIGLSARLMKPPVPAVLFLDCMMPALTGPAVLELLRRHPRLGEIPVVLMSASDTFRDAVVGHPHAAFVQKTGHVAPIVETALALLAVRPA
jgi:CheY-like chemotaxis protein